jgi:hypothetical protein
MTSFDPRIAEALGGEVPLRVELEPAWSDVLARAERPRRRTLASRWALAGALAAAVGLSVGGFAIADAVSSSLHRATVYISGATIGGPGGIANCSLIGEPADQAAATLAGSGVTVEWRSTDWGTVTAATVGDPTPTTPREKALEAARAGALEVFSAEAVTGGSSDAVDSPPAGSVVWDVIPDGRTKAFVFVEAAHDPNAPKIGCPG